MALPEVTSDSAERLAAAQRARQRGEIARAMILYGRLARDPLARADHRRRAAYQAARMRLDRGEASALVELSELLNKGLFPHEIARTIGAVRRSPLPDDPTTRASKEELVARCIEALRSRACVLDSTGVRARNWLRRTVDSNVDRAQLVDRALADG